MLELSSVGNPSKRIEERARHMWLRKITERGGIVEYRVTPKDKTKQRRLVRIDRVKGTAECRSFDTGACCPANAEFVPADPRTPKNAHLCAHVWRALQSLVR